MAFPDLQIYPESGLTFPWCEFLGESGSTSELNSGHDGVTQGMTMLINYDDLETALVEILGYSTKVAVVGPLAPPPQLSRVLPMRHPQQSQLWCTRIASARGVRFIGQARYVFGPVADYEFTLLSLSFTRPPYPVITDGQCPTDTLITNEAVPRAITYRKEYARYCDQQWKISTQMLTRRGMTMVFDEGAPFVPAGTPLPGAVGSKIVKMQLSRRWYQIPHNCIFNSSGFPVFYRINPLVVAPAPIPPGIAFGFLNDPNSYTIGTVNSDSFLGCEPETLLLTGVDIIPQPLPFPGNLIGIDTESNIQLQYDLVFNFDYSRQQRGVNYATAGIAPFLVASGPPAGALPFVPSRGGHNDLPWAVDGKWYRVRSQLNPDWNATPTIFQLYPFEWFFVVRDGS